MEGKKKGGWYGVIVLDTSEWTVLSFEVSSVLVKKNCTYCYSIPRWRDPASAAGELTQPWIPTFAWPCIFLVCFPKSIIGTFACNFSLVQYRSFPTLLSRRVLTPTAAEKAPDRAFLWEGSDWGSRITWNVDSLHPHYHYILWFISLDPQFLFLPSPSFLFLLVLARGNLVNEWWLWGARVERAQTVCAKLSKWKWSIILGVIKRAPLCHFLVCPVYLRYWKSWHVRPSWC